MADYAQASPPSQRTQALNNVNSLLDFINLCYEGADVEPWTVFKLTSEEYKALWSILEKQDSLDGWVLDKLRFDWSPHESEFIVRRPTLIREIFTARIVNEIQSQISAARKDERFAAFVSLVESEGCSDIRLLEDDSNHPKKSPDASFRYEDSHYPSVVIETSYFQNKKHLGKLANDYILGSNGNIKVIIGFDIHYGSGSKKATISIWRPRMVLDPDGSMWMEPFRDQRADPFRADDGTTARGHGFSLRLSDFAPDPSLVDISQEIQGKIVVEISCDKLTSFLCEAETLHEIRQAGRGRQDPLWQGCKKKRMEAGEGGGGGTY